MRVIASVNADMLFHYWKVGHFILYLQKKEGWGSKVRDNLATQTGLLVAISKQS